MKPKENVQTLRMIFGGVLVVLSVMEITDLSEARRPVVSILVNGLLIATGLVLVYTSFVPKRRQPPKDS